jgi:hypothetical protein
VLYSTSEESLARAERERRERVRCERRAGARWWHSASTSRDRRLPARLLRLSQDAPVSA